MGYFKYLSRDRKGFFIHSAKIIGLCAVVFVMLKILFGIEISWGTIALALLEGACGLLLIWLLYAIIEYFHYRKLP